MTFGTGSGQDKRRDGSGGVRKPFHFFFFFFFPFLFPLQPGLATVQWRSDRANLQIRGVMWHVRR